jgi:enoyl-CoA hydratase/carnithine racemase
VEPGRPVQQRRGGDPPEASPPGPLVEQAGAAGLRLELTGHRLDVVLADPQRRNAQTPATWRALAAVGAWAADAVAVVVIRAEGPSFSAGLDRRAFAPGGLPGEPGLVELAGLDPPALDATIASFQAGFTVWRRAPFVSIAAVQGHAVGAGFQLALACDVRIAATDARFAMREPALGLVPDLGGTGALVEAVGYARAVEICTTARWVEAPEAERLGLVQSVVPVDELASATGRLADAVLANPAAAVRATVTLLAGVRGRDAEAQLAAERSAQGDRLRALAREAPGG